MGDNNELRAKLEAASCEAIHLRCLDSPGVTQHEAMAHLQLARQRVTYLWPLLVAFGDARYQAGRNDAGDAVKGDCSHGDMHYGDFDPERCPICTHFITAARGEG